MLHAPRKLIYAIEAVLDIAYNAGSQPVQSSDVTRRQGISRRYLEPVLQQLVHDGILVGVRGPRGGYRLARERRRITLGDITRVVLEMTNSDETEEDEGSEFGRKVVRPLWREIEDEMLGRLDTVTVEELCLRARRQGLASDSLNSLDFSI